MPSSCIFPRRRKTESPCRRKAGSPPRKNTPASQGCTLRGRRKWIIQKLG